IMEWSKMDKRLVIIGIQEENLHYLRQQLNLVFGEKFNVIGVTLKELNYNSILLNDIVLLTTIEIKSLVEPFIPPSCDVIVAERAINIVNLKTLMGINKRMRMLVVNDNDTSTKETINTLKNLLPNHAFEAYSIQKEIPVNIDYVITPGEVHLITPEMNIAPIFDIGPRFIALETLIELKNILKLNITDSLMIQLFIKSMVCLTGEKTEVSLSTLQNENHQRSFSQLSTKSPYMLYTIQIYKQVAYSSNSIHIEGNVGTGKQMLAEMIHNASPLSTMPFYVYSCSEKDPQIIDKELFGRPGDSDGIIYQINSGTLFIKSIDQLPYLVQEKLHNLIVENYKRSTNKIRIITASLDSLNNLFKQELIHTNLFAYLSPYIVKMPDLSERLEDIPILIHTFKKHFNKLDLQFSEETIRTFQMYNWPGNVRELYNVISYCVCLEKEYIEPMSLPLFFKGRQKHGQASGPDLDIDQIIKEIEQHGFLSESISLLEIFNDGKHVNESYGRGKVKQILQDKGYHLTDQQLKLRINILNNLGLLNVRIGRAGTTIAEKGERFLRQYKSLQQS